MTDLPSALVKAVFKHGRGPTRKRVNTRQWYEVENHNLCASTHTFDNDQPRNDPRCQVEYLDLVGKTPFNPH